MTSPLEINIKFAEALVDNLSRLGGQGHHKMGYYAQMFLSEVAIHGRIRPVHIKEYLADITATTNQIKWAHPEPKANAERLIELVAAYADEPGLGQALDIIHYRL